jgi:hypothetical protein
VIALAVTAAMAADLVTFALAVPAVGIAAEMNPVMAAAYSAWGILPVAILKIAALAAIVAGLAMITPGPRRRFAAGIGIAVGQLGVFGNTTAWLEVTR